MAIQWPLWLFYGPTNRLSTKLVLGITYNEGSDPELFKWFNEVVDIRSNVKILMKSENC